MKAIELIRSALALSDRATRMLIEDMQDAPLTAPTPGGGNHPLWVLGHLTLVEASLPHILSGEANPVEKWAPLFAPGSQPVNDASLYPSMEELLATYTRLRARNLELLDEIGDEGLDAPTKFPPKGLEEVFGTVGSMFLTVALHQMNHRGQVADARRALGRSPLFTPGAG